MNSIMDLEIEITQEDIDKGVRCRPGYCAAAVAIRRQLNVHPASLVLVSPAGVRIGSDTYTCSKELLSFVRRFDRRVPVAPCSFKVRYIGKGIEF